MPRGSLLHTLLEIIILAIQELCAVIDVVYLDKILQTLNGSCGQTYPSTPLRYGFQRGPRWKHELKEIRRLLTRSLV